MYQIYKTIDTKKRKYCVNIQFFDKYLMVQILEKDSAWQSKVSKDFIDKFAANFNISTTEYIKKLQEYFNNTPENVEFKFLKEDFSCYYNENGIKLKYFTVKLEKQEFSKTVYELLEIYTQNYKNLQEENKKINKERVEYQQDSINLKTKLTEFIERKQKDEEELYSNFVVVLNEKKRKIQHLNQLLYAFKAGRPPLNPIIKRKIKQTTKEIVKESVSESESSDNDNYNTDEEKDNKIITSTSPKQQLNSFSDDSEDICTLPKRKKRNNKIVETDINMPSTSKIGENIQPKDKVSKKDDLDSSAIIFNTQDLLDHI